MPGYAVAWTSFSELERQTVTYDTTHRLSASRLITGSTTHALVQYSYDTAGRTQCVAQRMNPATFASPPSSACTPCCMAPPETLPRRGSLALTSL